MYSGKIAVPPGGSGIQKKKTINKAKKCIFSSEPEFSGRGAVEARKHQASIKATFWQTQPHELQKKRHYRKNYKFLLFLAFSNR
jgi:hypothetical protein